MYLSRLTLNLRNAGARRDLKNWYEMHRTLARAIDGREDERLLFRVEQPDYAAPIVLVQTNTAPDWERFEAEVPGYALNVEGMEIRPSFAPGQLFQFRLRANAVKARNGKRVRLENEEEEYEWLKRRLEQGGAELIGTLDHRSGLTTMKHTKGTIYLHTIETDGFIRVADPDAFLNTMQAGIGRAKGLGMGLLSVKRYAA